MFICLFILSLWTYVNSSLIIDNKCMSYYWGRAKRNWGIYNRFVVYIDFIRILDNFLLSLKEAVVVKRVLVNVMVVGLMFNYFYFLILVAVQNLGWVLILNSKSFENWVESEKRSVLTFFSFCLFCYMRLARRWVSQAVELSFSGQ